ncbi:peptidase U32 family protein, partial [Bittarella massiliensis (ex Durand et al. 2017)]
HGSTQMSIHSPAGARQLARLGFSRAILARELSLKEIAASAREGALELEVFIHGALCMSVSGQGLMSAVIGGRSGNRGDCAGTCRLPFCAVSSPEEASALPG